jgi:hypothetical protein
VFENRMLRRMYGSKKEDDRENYRMKNFIVCTHHLILLS